MKLHYDKHHRELSFDPGQFVWLKLQPYRQHSLRHKAASKLAPKFYGPYKVLRWIGSVAYQLELPETSRIHDVFHISLLKPFTGVPPDQVPSLPPLKDGKIVPQPKTVTRFHFNRGILEVLVEWCDLPPTIPLPEFHATYPAFELEDKLVVQEGCNVMDAFLGKTYHRRRQQ
ncbi:PREDICTED: uncharacterized protein LOC109115595 [Nelumbo nucifera]|uniref:Uncharacterized protein LOC109115595 n=1 Tax=Nelumbo nucifera TaxID=4432 RepID=A0A1U8QBB9_NELNU|nr:PREDICTED: uncharacterized protein LOC109115595 [Nelumbo nucifera]